jgi:peroxiredoxin
MQLIPPSRLGNVILIALPATFIGCGVEQHRSTSVISNAASNLLDLNGRPHALLAVNQHAVTVVVFTRTDCPISNRAAPEIRHVYEIFHPRGVELYLIYVDPRQPPDAIRAHLKEYEYPCPALRDPEHSLVAATGATVTPEAVVFDANHRIAYRGRIDDRSADVGQSRSVAVKHDLAEAIEATLAGRPVGEPMTKAVGCLIADLK